MEVCVKFSFISIFSPFSGLKQILSDSLILPVSQLQTQQVTTSQIIWNRLIIFFCSFCSRNWWKI